MRRRDLVALFGGAALSWPGAAAAQQPGRLRRVGVLMSTAEGDPEGNRRHQAFVAQLEALGWVEGRNVSIDTRWAAGDLARTRLFANELVALAPEIIVTQNTAAVPPVQQATRSIAIVFTQVTEPVAAGFVASMASPGGNITGFTSFESSMGAKWLEILKQLAPRVTRAAFVFNPDTAANRGVNFLRAAAEGAATFGIDVVPAPFSNAGEITQAIAALSREPHGGLVVLPDAGTNANRQIILALAAEHSLPAVYAFPFFVKAGGLVSYGPDPIDQFMKAAGYVDRILKGAKPGQLPVQQPTKFELVVNLRTARTLGLTVPQSMLLSADEVIE